MKESYLFDMTFNNIIFKGRNQAYGAYALRKSYSRHIATAAITATAIFSGALVWPLVQGVTSEKVPEKVKQKEVVFIVPLDIPPPPPVAEKAELVRQVEQPRKQATVAYTKTKVVADNAPVKEAEMPTQEELATLTAGTTTTDGAPAAEAPVVDGTGAGTAPVSIAEPAPNAVYDFVAEMPAYDGGEQALIKYLSKNLRYPGEAVRAGVEGIVVVSFVVNSNGEVSEATVVKSLGFGTDEEALRVIRKMPHWKPGRQNGQPVAVRFTMPIRFSMQR